MVPRSALLPLIVILTALLAGCVPSAGGPGAAGEISETPLPPPAETATSPDADQTAVEPDALIEADPGAEAEAAPEPAAVPDLVPEPAPPMLAQQRAACESDGGRLMPRGSGFFACVYPTRDSGQHCNAGADCEGLCLARSGTCAPLRPLFGCNEVFTLPGRRETLCTD